MKSIFALVLLLPFMLLGQTIDSSKFELDNNRPKLRVLKPWPELNSRDVICLRLVERMLDTREKQNSVLNYPLNNFSYFIYQQILDYNLLPYVDENRSKIFSLEDFVLIGCDTIYESSRNDSINVAKFSILSFDPKVRIYKYKIVEAWMFDKRLNQYFARILSIAPQYEKFINGESAVFYDLCYLQYYSKDGKDLRHLLFNKIIYTSNDQQTEYSFDDWFEKRMF
ncbi:MAG: hypothetical protein K9J84_14735, partial [Bacteroidia bacterium]|nr:hypothetical protein [Bacteroidia bacterium]